MYSWNGGFTTPGKKEPCAFCMLVKQLEEDPSPEHRAKFSPEDIEKIGIHLRIAHGVGPWTPIPN